MANIISTIGKSITFFKTEADARSVATKGEMTEAEGFFVKASTGRPGMFVIEVHDTDDGLMLGYV